MTIKFNLNLLTGLIIFSLGIISITPYFNNLIFKAIFLSIVVAYAFILNFVKSFKFSHVVAMLLIVIFYLYASVGYSNGFSNASIGRYGELFGFFTPLLIYYFISNNLDDQTTRLLCKVIIYFAAFFLVTINIFSLLQNPLLLIQMNYIDTSGEEYFHIGNTITAAGWTLLGLIFIYDKSNNKLMRYAFIFIFSAYCLVSTKTIMTLLFFMAIIYPLFGVTKRLRINSFFGLILISTILIVVLFPLITQDDRIYHIGNRIESIFAFFTQGMVGEQTLRFELAILSFVTFLENPIFGVGYDFVSLDGNASNAIKSGIGHHSAILDFLARFGLVGMTIIYFSIRPFVLDLYKNKDPYFNLGPISFFILLFAFGNNVISFEFGFIVFLLLPIVSYRKSLLLN